LPWISVEKVEDAVNVALAKAENDDMILVAGSVFVVGEARKIWKGTTKRP
jgi:folylpolyglutamate synthase/dihydropteroate synthase